MHFWQPDDNNIGFGIDLNLPSVKTTQVAFYLPNFDTGRTEVEFWDLNTNALLTSITCDKLWDGCYLVYELSGNINVQIAFNVIPMGEDGYGTTPKGTMPRYVGYKYTDYEYALNQVAPQYGGGTEIWRLLVPGMPEKHFYPRQPKSPFDGPVKNGKLAITHEGSTRITECAIPWSELPDVKKALDA